MFFHPFACWNSIWINHVLLEKTVLSGSVKLSVVVRSSTSLNNFCAFGTLQQRSALICSAWLRPGHTKHWQISTTTYSQIRWHHNLKPNHRINPVWTPLQLLNNDRCLVRKGSLIILTGENCFCLVFSFLKRFYFGDQLSESHALFLSCDLVLTLKICISWGGF